jgi:hypothetical protein
MNDLQQLLRELTLSQPRIIGVDGELGVGKSTLADRIAAHQHCACLHLDSFLLKGRASFLPSLKYDQLAAAVSAETGTVVIEGVCLLAVLKRLSVVPDYLVFVASATPLQSARKSLLLTGEVQDYIAGYSPRSKANLVISQERSPMSSSFDVDIAYIRAKTMISIVLALGGLAQTISGVILLNAGLSQQGTATLKIMGAEISATGLGGIVLCTSVMWAYFAYLARPKFSSKAESRSATKADGSSEVYEFRSSTQIAADPHRQGKTPP